MLTRRQLLGAAALAPLIGCSSAAQHTRPVKILLDTDIGSDIDDAVALAYLLRQPRAHLLGITTVSGQAAARAALAEALCRAAGAHVPIYPGIEAPLHIPQRQTVAPQAERLGRTRFARHDSDTAIRFLADTIRAHPGEITLLAVGPLTNIATLFQQAPDTAALLDRLVLMVGKYSDYPTPWGPTEWNAIVDPHATDIVFRHAPGKITAFGLDITWQVSMTPAEVASQFRDDELLELVLDWSGVWFRERELLHFHDPLAAAAIFQPDICQYTSGTVEVLLTEIPKPGITRFIRDQGKTIIASGVNQQRFFDAYFEVFG